MKTPFPRVSNFAVIALGEMISVFLLRRDIPTRKTANHSAVICA